MEQNLKLVTYNLRNGFNAKRLVNNVAKMVFHGADLFCFQEFRKFNGRPFVGEELQTIFGQKWEVEHFLKEDTHDLGLCVMWNKSKLNLMRVEKITLPKISSLKIAIKVLEKLFFARKLPVQRGAIVAEFKMGGGLLRVANVHLDWIGGLKHKAGQLQYLVDYLKNNPQFDYEIICGDFNTVGPLGLVKKRRQKIFEAFDGDFVDVSSRLRLTTHNFQKLDHIFSRGFSRMAVKRLFLFGSDHMPLFAKFELQNFIKK